MPWLAGYWALAIIKMLLVLPETVSPLPVGPSVKLVPLNCHCSAGTGLPDTVVTSDAVFPCMTVTLPGPVITGATRLVLIVSASTLLVAEP